MSTIKHISSYLWKGLLAAVLAGTALVLISAVKTKDAKPCRAIEIHYKKERQSGFVTRQEILDAINKQVTKEAVGTPLQNFDLSAIEKSIETHPWILDAQLYFDNNQVLHVTLDEPLPVARVIDVRGRHFYIDADAQEMPVSKLKRVELPVVTGAPVRRDSATGKVIMQKVATLSEVMATDDFWLAQAAQIDIQPDGKIEMVPVIGNHIADLGYGDSPQQMLQRLKQFYQAMVATGRLDDYKRISAAYSGQIVAQRSSTRITTEERAAAMQSYRQMVKTNQQAVDSASVSSNKGVGRLVTTSSSEPAPSRQQGGTVSKKAEDKPAPEKAAEKQQEKTTAKEQDKKETTDKPKEEEKPKEPEQKKVPKAVMPKIENN